MIMRMLYQTSATLAAPILTHLLAKRARGGKEDPARLEERRGIASLARPNGSLVWIHAASNGEAMSALPLVHRLLDEGATGSVLMTTGTVTSARLMADRLPAGAFHQFVPLDRPAWVKAFLAHWQPDLGIWIESELWPSLIWEMRSAGRPMALVNGRISPRSLSRWQKRPALARDLLSGFAPCLTQTDQDAADLASLGAHQPECVGNLKLAGAPLPVDQGALAQFESARGGRALWLAASTHPGEEEIVADAHARLLKDDPELLCVLVPRHPRRSGDIISRLRARGLSVSQRSETDGPATGDQIYVADTLGELGLFYRAAPVALLGGSLAGDHGGHNPLEAAHLDCRVLHGPDMRNFSTIAATLAEKGVAETVRDVDSLAFAVRSALAKPSGTGMPTSISETLARDGAKTLDAVMARLHPILARAEAA